MHLGQTVIIEEIGDIEFVFRDDASYSLQNDIDWNGSAENKWVPIDNFKGVLDGKNHKIEKIYIDIYNNGGFIRLQNGIIKNLNLEMNMTVTTNAGVLCATNNNKIENCMVRGNINGGNSIAGIAHTNNGIVLNCINETSLLMGAGGAIGGIVVNNNGSIINSYNNGKISPGASRGGIASTNSAEGIIRNCYNIGDVDLSPYAYVGGGIAANNYGLIENCYNGKKIKCGAHTIGGIVGRNYNRILNCYNIGEVKGNNNNIASLVGYNEGSIDKCYYLTGTSNVAYGTTSTGTYTNSSNKDEADMKTIEFINLLNSTGENVFKEDKNLINNGYPILNWQ